MTAPWKTEMRAVATLQLDGHNPRFEIGAPNPSQADLVRLLFHQHDAMEIAKSIARGEFFANEPLLGIKEGNQVVVVEGNRRLAALKALRQPSLLEGSHRKAVERLVKRMRDPKSIIRVPVVIATSRKATDAQIATRHAGGGLRRAWDEANRSRFILDKLDEGYTEAQIHSDLGFTPGNINDARFFRSMIDVARSLDLPAATKDAVLRGDFAVTTLERVLASTPARHLLHIHRDDKHGFVVRADAAPFKRALAKVVEDVVEKPKDYNSRTLNNDTAIEAYLKDLGELLPVGRKDAITPDELTPAAQEEIGQAAVDPAPLPSKRAKKPTSFAVPKSFKPQHGSPKVLIIYGELISLDRERKRYAAAVLLRVFLELAIVDYLKRLKKWAPFVAKLKQEGAKLQYDVPPMNKLVKAVLEDAKEKLQPDQFSAVQKALTYHDGQRFNIDELQSFVHGRDVPTGTDLEQFWIRTEPLFEMMLCDPPT